MKAAKAAAAIRSCLLAAGLIVSASRQATAQTLGLSLRGSMEGESDLVRRLHLVGAFGVERSRSGIAAMLHGSLVPASPTSAAVDDAREVQRWESTEPDAEELKIRRRTLAALGMEWQRETDRLRRQLALREQVRAGGGRILVALGDGLDAIRAWDNLGAIERVRIERLAIAPVP